MHIHNFCVRNGDNLNLLIKTADAHKQKIFPQTTIITSKKYEKGGIETLGIVKNDGVGHMVVAFTITEINYLVVSLF